MHWMLTIQSGTPQVPTMQQPRHDMHSVLHWPLSKGEGGESLRPGKDNAPNDTTAYSLLSNIVCTRMHHHSMHDTGIVHDGLVMSQSPLHFWPVWGLYGPWVTALGLSRLQPLSQRRLREGLGSPVLCRPWWAGTQNAGSFSGVSHLSSTQNWVQCKIQAQCFTRW